MAVCRKCEPRAVVAAVHQQTAGLDRRQGRLRQGHPVEVGDGFQRWGAETDDIGERPCQHRHRRPRVPVGLDRETRRAGFEQRDGERLRCDEFAQAARRGSPGIGIGGLDAKLEKCHVPLEAGWVVRDVNARSYSFPTPRESSRDR